MDNLVVMVMLVLGIGGVLTMLFPKVLWFFKEGWKFRNTEPSRLWLILTRIGGFVQMAVGFTLAWVFWGTGVR